MFVLLMIGYQNEYFSASGKFHELLKGTEDISALLHRSLKLVDSVHSRGLVVTAPIGFDSEYSDIESPYGILKDIKDNKAFIEGSFGYETIIELQKRKSNIVHLKTRRTLNAFQDTDFQIILNEHEIKDIYIAGVFTSLCVDSSARTAYELGYNVTILTDLIAGRTILENEFYVENVFPAYCHMKTSDQIIEKDIT